MFNRFKDDLKKYWKYAIYSSKAQLKSEIANSYLNWLWWVLDPLCFMLIYVFMFGYVFKSKEQYFAIFVFVGITLWDFFNKCLLQSVKIIKNNKPIVSKVYIPKFILLVILNFRIKISLFHGFHRFRQKVQGLIDRVNNLPADQNNHRKNHPRLIPFPKKAIFFSLFS